LTASITATSSPSLTASPSATPTDTWTSTFTPTAADLQVLLPFPNPSKNGDPVTIQVDGPGTLTVHWSVFTTAFRKVRKGEAVLVNGGTFQWDLKDDQRQEVASGLYYLRLDAQSSSSRIQKVFKILVLR
jgi:hypothetical protein